jgi:hypothetical protein
MGRNLHLYYTCIGTLIVVRYDCRTGCWTPLCIILFPKLVLGTLSSAFTTCMCLIDVPGWYILQWTACGACTIAVRVSISGAVRKVINSQGDI